MSSGASCRKEKPRSGVSNCIEDAPRSSRMPSTASHPSCASCVRTGMCRRLAPDGCAVRKEPRSYEQAPAPAGPHRDPAVAHLAQTPPKFRGHVRPRPMSHPHSARHVTGLQRVYNLFVKYRLMRCVHNDRCVADGQPPSATTTSSFERSSVAKRWLLAFRYPAA